MPQINIEMRSKGAVDEINKIAAGLHPALARGLIRAAYHVDRELKAEIYATFPEGRTGGLPRSFKPTFTGRDGDELSAAVKSSLSYARIQDEGGTITPKSGKFLAVPINKRIAVGKWPRHFAPGELTLIPRKGKPSMLVKITGAGGGRKREKWTPMFILVRSVHIRGRNYIQRAEAKAAPGVLEIIGATIDRLTTAEGGSGDR